MEERFKKIINAGHFHVSEKYMKVPEKYLSVNMKLDKLIRKYEARLRAVERILSDRFYETPVDRAVLQSKKELFKSFIFELKCVRDGKSHKI